MLCLVFSFLLSSPLWAAEKARLRVDDYQIDAELTPHSHKISARAKVKFTALEDLNIATFELHNALRVTKVVDAAGKLLSAERVTQDSTIRVPLTTPVAKDSSSTLTFEYEGVLDSADDSPVQGLKLAYISDDTTYLLYAGRWFPVNAYGINRFTATMNITVPAHMTVIGSGKESPGSPPPLNGRPARYLPRLSPLPGTSQAFLAPSSPASFRSSKAMRPGWIFTSSLSRNIRLLELRTQLPRSKSSRTT